MRFSLILFQVLIILMRRGETVKVFSFDAARETPADASPSFMSLTNSPEEPLPGRFIICSSHKQREISGDSFYILYGEDRVPWLSLSVWDDDGSIDLWADVQFGLWHQLPVSFQRPWTHFWRHICLDIDTVSGNCTVSVNGGEASTVTVQDILTHKPDFLKLSIGIVQYAGMDLKQFHGAVTNVNLFHNHGEKSVKEMSENPCLFAASADLLAWSDMDWRTEGNFISQTEEDDGTVCERQETYRVALPVKMTWMEADQTCQNLGHGQITQTLNQTELVEFVTWIERNLGVCGDIWTPVTDKEEEGFYISVTNGEIVEDLTWWRGEPNGGHFENYISIQTRSNMSAYRDLPGDSLNCVSCTLDVTTIFTLWGRCKNTYLGRHVENKLYHY